jgi:predicted nucleotidyltransferase
MKQLLKVRVGSHAFSTNIETSDEDFFEVHQCSNDEIFGFNYRDELQFTKDHKSFELKKFLELLLKANPTTLEMLFSDERNIIYKDPSLNWLFENKEMFVTKQSLQTFGNYAISQIQKATALDKKANWEKERIVRKDILDFCFVNIENGKSKSIKQFLFNKGYKQSDIGLSSIPHMKNTYYMFLPKNYFDDFKSNFKGIVKNPDNSNMLSLSSIPKDSISIGLLYFNLESYQSHCKDYKEYKEWLSKRNTQRYTWDQGKISYDLKNIMHCRRLLNVALEITEKGTFTVLRPEAKDLIEIRRSNVKIEEVMRNLENDKNKILESFKSSRLPERVDQKLIEDYLIKMRNNYEKD